MFIDGNISEDINQYKIVSLTNTEGDYILIPNIIYDNIDNTRKYSAEFLNFLPEEIIETNAPKIFKYNSLNNTRVLLTILELTHIKNIKQIDFYLENDLKFSIVLEDLDRKYSQIIQFGFGEDKTPNLSIHNNNKNPHKELLTIGLIEKIDNVNIPSSLYSESITIFSSSGFIGNTLVDNNFGKRYMGEKDEQ